MVRSQLRLAAANPCASTAALPFVPAASPVNICPLSRGLKPGDTIDFTLDGGDYLVLDPKLVSHEE